jgi:SsrA-binding protein
MKILAKNKKAYFDYEIIDKVEAWLVLSWHEVKSCKVWHPNISDAFVRITHDGMRISNMDIPRYTHTSPHITPWYDAKGKRSLLMTKKQRTKWREQTQKTWLRIIPLTLFINQRWYIKVELWLGKLKKKVEKKQRIKERDIKKEMDAIIKEYKR